MSKINPKKYYTQKDICRLLNIKRETLRHYEKEGLIHPVIQANNQYRLYDDYQMYLISECKRYQQNSFSIREIREMLKDDSLEQYSARIQNRKNLFEEKVNSLEKQLKLLREYSAKLERINEETGRCEICDMDEMVFAAQKTGTQLMLDQDSLDALNFIYERLSLTFMMACMHEGDCLWGYGLYNRYIENEDFSRLKLHHIKASKAIRCVIDCGNFWEFDESLKEPLISYALNHNLKPGSGFYLIQLVKIGEEKDMHRYFEAYLPVE